MIPEEFWNQDIQHLDQKFYSAFCLLQSALADYAVACDLKNRNILNWSATAYYYSIVHTSRLLCFLVVGDFPTSHHRLAELFQGSNNTTTNWLEKFNNNPNNPNKIVGIRVTVTDLFNYFANTCPGLSNTDLIRWGKILEKACDCRNESNYEMYIMAHEFRHSYVTPDFHDLTSILKRHAESILPIGVCAFKFFIEVDGKSGYDRTSSWNSFLNWENQEEGLENIREFIEYRLNGGE